MFIFDIQWNEVQRVNWNITIGELIYREWKLSCRIEIRVMYLLVRQLERCHCRQPNTPGWPGRPPGTGAKSYSDLWKNGTVSCDSSLSLPANSEYILSSIPFIIPKIFKKISNELRVRIRPVATMFSCRTINNIFLGKIFSALFRFNNLYFLSSTWYAFHFEMFKTGTDGEALRNW